MPRLIDSKVDRGRAPAGPTAYRAPLPVSRATASRFARSRGALAPVVLNREKLDASCLARSPFAAEICRRRTQHIFMVKRFIYLVAIALIGGSATMFAQGGAKPANVGEGTVMVKGKNYSLKNAAAYETTVDGEDGIAVVLSGPTISSEKINEARKSEKKGEPSDFRRPYLKLEFTKTGEFKGWGAATGDVSLGRRRGSNATGEIKLQDGRAVGKASQPNETEGMFPSGLEVR